MATRTASNRRVPAFSTTSASPDGVAADLLAVAVFADRRLGDAGRVVDEALGGALDAYMEAAGFSGKPGETLTLPAGPGLSVATVLLVGVGDAKARSAEGLRRAGAALARRAGRVRTVATTLLEAAPEELGSADAARALAEGVCLGRYQFLRYKGDPKPSRLERVVLVGPGGARVRAALDRATRVSEAVMFARDLVNEPAGAKSPADLAREARRVARACGLKITVWQGEQLRRERLGGVIGVGQGSERPPCLVRLAYEPAGARSTLALVGKGVVFDSGGLSIKPATGMETMKTDMSGAAAVLATMSALADLGVKHRVVAYVPLVENMPSGSAIRPGDVLKIRNGKTVEVLNTDAEGRLILADGLALAAEDRPDAIVDVATLTGACVVALGEKVAGLMGNDDEWVAQVRAAADASGEPVWPLPLPADYRRQLESDIADLKNITGNSYGGTLTAGLFLQSFVGDIPWVHLDIAGPARAAAEDGTLTKGGTGFAVRTLLELASTFRRPARKARK